MFEYAGEIYSLFRAKASGFPIVSSSEYVEKSELGVATLFPILIMAGVQPHICVLIDYNGKSKNCREMDKPLLC